LNTIQGSWEVVITIAVLVALVLVALMVGHYYDYTDQRKIDKEMKRLKGAWTTNEGKSIRSKMSVTFLNSSFWQTVSRRISTDNMFSMAHKNPPLSRRDRRLSMNKTTYKTDEQLLEDALPSILQAKPFSERFATEVKQNHRWFGVVFFYSTTFPRVLRIVSLACNIIVLLFIQSITYNLTNPDDGSCGELTAYSECIEPRSDFSEDAPKCAWTPNDLESATTGTGTCSFIEPESSI